MKQPLVSVLMPAYNAEKYITEAIESILNQTYKNFEFIIIDDCSTDKTWKIIQKYQKKDQRIIIFRNKENLNLGKTLNLGINNAKGKYIARMDADDISLPYRLEMQVKFLEDNPRVGIVGSNLIIIDKNNYPIATRRYPLKDKDIRNKIFLYNPFAHPVIMYRKNVVQKAGLYHQKNINKVINLVTYIYVLIVPSYIKVRLFNYLRNTKL